MYSICCEEVLVSQGTIASAVTSALHDALLKARIEGALCLHVWPNFTLDTPKRAEWGDLATTVAMGLAKLEKRHPREIADIIASNLQSNTDLFDRVDVVSPGYINLTIRRDQWFRVLKEIDRRGPSYGSSKTHADQKILIEFVSANPTGPLHVGHGRGAAVGDALARLLTLTGADVSREYYVNDVGTQIEMLGRSVLLRAQHQCSSSDKRYVLLPEGLYQGRYIADIAAAYVKSQPSVMWKSDGTEVITAGSFAKDSILQGIFEDLRHFRVDFDSVFEEHTMHEDGTVRDALDAMRAKQYVYTLDDAEWLATSQWGDDKDRVVKRATGHYTYFASDIAYHAHKFRRGFNRLINVWGADHHGYVPRIRAVICALGYPDDGFRVSLVQLVRLVRGGKPIPMSTRTGEFITLREVIDDVGVDAARFFFLMRRSDTPLDFDLDLAKQKSNENPVFYVQYVHARIASLFDVAQECGIDRPSISDVELSLLRLPEELALVKKLAEYPEIVSESARCLEPHRVTYYLQDLAGLFHAYYYKHRILLTDAPSLSLARLALMASIQTVVRNGLTILGVSAPDVM